MEVGETGPDVLSYIGDTVSRLDLIYPLYRFSTKRSLFLHFGTFFLHFVLLTSSTCLYLIRDMKVLPLVAHPYSPVSIQLQIVPFPLYPSRNLSPWLFLTQVLLPWTYSSPPSHSNFSLIF